MAGHDLGMAGHDILPLRLVVVISNQGVREDGALDPIPGPGEVANPWQITMDVVPGLQRELTLQPHQLGRLIRRARARLNGEVRSGCFEGPLTCTHN